MSKSGLKVISVISADEKAHEKCLEISHRLRQKGFQVDQPVSGNMGKKMKRANKLGAQFAVLIGESELTAKTLTIKNLILGTQVTVDESLLESDLESILESFFAKSELSDQLLS